MEKRKKRGRGGGEEEMRDENPVKKRHNRGLARAGQRLGSLARGGRGSTGVS